MMLPLAVCLGCSSARVTEPSRTATEQFLLSHAAQEAVAQLAADALRDRKVFVDTAYFAAAEQAFVVGQLRAHLLQAGVHLVPDRAAAEIVLEARSGGVGIDRYGYLVGMTSMTLGQLGSAAGAGPLPLGLPELAVFKSLRQYGFASIAFVAYRADSGDLVASSGPFIGHSKREDWWLLGMGPYSKGNIAPLKK